MAEICFNNATEKLDTKNATASQIADHLHREMFPSTSCSTDAWRNNAKDAANKFALLTPEKATAVNAEYKKLPGDYSFVLDLAATPVLAEAEKLQALKPLGIRNDADLQRVLDLETNSIGK